MLIIAQRCVIYHDNILIQISHNRMLTDIPKVKAFFFLDGGGVGVGGVVWGVGVGGWGVGCGGFKVWLILVSTVLCAIAILQWKTQ